jgi:hypothetical protein
MTLRIAGSSSTKRILSLVFMKSSRVYEVIKTDLIFSTGRSGLNGLVMWSFAPNFLANWRISGRPVKTIIGIWEKVRTVSITFMPVTSGMRMSSNMISGSRVLNSSIASAPRVVVMTPYHWSLSFIRTNFPMPGSPSTTNTRCFVSTVLL